MSYVVGCCNVVAILSMADTAVCRNCAVLVQCLSNVGSVWYVGVLSYAEKFYCC